MGGYDDAVLRIYLKQVPMLGACTDAPACLPADFAPSGSLSQASAPSYSGPAGRDGVLEVDRARPLTALTR